MTYKLVVIGGVSRMSRPSYPVQAPTKLTTRPLVRDLTVKVGSLLPMVRYSIVFP